MQASSLGWDQLCTSETPRPPGWQRLPKRQSPELTQESRVAAGRGTVQATSLAVRAANQKPCSMAQRVWHHKQVGLAGSRPFSNSGSSRAALGPFGSGRARGAAAAASRAALGGGARRGRKPGLGPARWGRGARAGGARRHRRPPVSVISRREVPVLVRDRSPRVRRAGARLPGGQLGPCFSYDWRAGRRGPWARRWGAPRGTLRSRRASNRVQSLLSRARQLSESILNPTCDLH